MCDSRTRPSGDPEILHALLQSQAAFPGNRIGFVIEAMGAFSSHRELLPKVVAFVEPHTRSAIASVATKARKVMKNVPAPNPRCNERKGSSADASPSPHVHGSTFTSRPKIEFAPIRPLICPRLFPIWNRRLILAFGGLLRCLQKR